MEKMNLSLGLAVVMTALIISFTLLSAPVCAEEKQDNATTNMDILRQKIQADKKLVVAANMDLTDAEAKVFWPIYQEYQDKLTKINQQTGKLIADYAQNYKSMTSEIAQRLLKKSMAVEKERLSLKEQFMPKLQKALPAVKVARYYQIENKIQAVLQYELAGSIPLME